MWYFLKTHKEKNDHIVTLRSPSPFTKTQRPKPLPDDYASVHKTSHIKTYFTSLEMGKFL